MLLKFASTMANTEKLVTKPAPMVVKYELKDVLRKAAWGLFLKPSGDAKNKPT